MNNLLLVLGSLVVASIAHAVPPQFAPEVPVELPNCGGIVHIRMQDSQEWQTVGGQYMMRLTVNPVCHFVNVLKADGSRASVRDRLTYDAPDFNGQERRGFAGIVLSRAWPSRDLEHTMFRVQVRSRDGRVSDDVMVPVDERRCRDLPANAGRPGIPVCHY